MRLECGGKQCLKQLALRAGFHAHAALLPNHIALLVEFAKHRIVEALRLQQEPQFQTVSGEIVEVVGGVFTRARVQTHAAVLFDQLRVGVRDHIAVSLLHGGFQRLLQIRQLFWIGLQALVALGVVLIVNVFDLIHGFALERIVLGANGLGSLERHVFEHVRDAGFAARIVHRARVHVRVKGHHRRLVPLENDEVQPVGEREFSDAFFEIFQGLRR